MSTSPNILIVEDEAIVAMGIKNNLKNLGYTNCTIAHTADESVKICKSNDFNLVLMDIKLKGKLDGIEAALQIRKQQHVPVIFLTAYADEETVKRAKQVQPSGYILKPFQERELKAAIELALYKHQMEQELQIKRHAIESSINAIAITDLDGIVTYVNPSFVTMWNYHNDEEIIGKPLFSFWKHKGRYVELFDKLFEKQVWQGDLEAERRDGSTFNVYLSANIIVDDLDKPLCTLASFIDVSKQKQYEKEIVKTKDYLQNIIDSATSFIMVIDKANKIKLWNKTAEQITGYKSREVLGKNIQRHSLFSKGNDLSKQFQPLRSGLHTSNQELIIHTKNDTIRIFSISCSLLQANDDQQQELLVIGNDITSERQTHGKLITGFSYILVDKDKDAGLRFYQSLLHINKKALLITRTSYQYLPIKPSKDASIKLMGEQKGSKKAIVYDLQELERTVAQYCKNTTHARVVLDRIDYLITNHSFNEFIQTIYRINALIQHHNGILVVHVNPAVLDVKELALLGEELSPLPDQRIEDVQLEDELFEILRFIYDQNTSNVLVSFKKISKEFSIVKSTTAKRLRSLTDKGFISVKKKGRQKTVHVTEKGKTLLKKREII